MRTFDIYSHPSFGVDVVKQGFSWPAFFFGWIWALTKDLSFPVAGLLAGSIFFLGFQMWFEQNHPLVSLQFGVGGIAFQVWVGRNGNDWRRRNLRKNNYTFVASETDRSAKAVRAAHPAVPDQGVS